MPDKLQMWFTVIILSENTSPEVPKQGSLLIHKTADLQLNNYMPQ